MPTTRILSHNAYWFQGHPFKGDAPPAPNPQVVADLAALYKSLSPSLICLQEVQSQDAQTLLSKHLQSPGFYTPGRQLTQYGGASFSPTASLLADSKASHFAHQRVWQILTLPGRKSHLTIANCHLPSARQLTGPQAAAQRVLELQSLLTLHPRIDVLLGDFNETGPGPVADFLSSQGYLDAAIVNQIPGLPTNVTSVKKRRGDQIWVKTSLASSLTGYGVVTELQMRTNLPGLTHLSDHFPLWIDL